MTYTELIAMSDGYARRQKGRYNELIYAAWHTAALTAAAMSGKKLPSLDSLLHKNENQNKPRKQQTDEEMMAMARLLNAAFGGEVIEK